jgi:hypothetical protein
MLMNLESRARWPPLQLATNSYRNTNRFWEVSLMASDSQSLSVSETLSLLGMLSMLAFSSGPLSWIASMYFLLIRNSDA